MKLAFWHALAACWHIQHLTRVSCRMTRVTEAQGQQYIVAWARDAHIQCRSRDFFWTFRRSSNEVMCPSELTNGLPSNLSAGHYISVHVTMANVAYGASPSRTSCLRANFSLPSCGLFRYACQDFFAIKVNSLAVK
jgi:hypothetical protein